MYAKTSIVVSLLWIACSACAGDAPPPAHPAPQQTAHQAPAAPVLTPPPDGDAGQTVETALARLTEFRDAMCKCATRRCANDVVTAMRGWSVRAGEDIATRGAELTEGTTRRMAGVAKELTDCLIAARHVGSASSGAATGMAAGGTSNSAATATPNEPTHIAPTVLDAYRVAGNKNIVPDNDVKLAFAGSGKRAIVTSYKVCVDVSGDVANVSVLRPSGYPTYDAKIEREIRAWRYRPFRIDGAPVPVCTGVTFIYSQTPASPKPRPKS